MDKVFMLIVILIIGFWGFLKYSESSNWVATNGNGEVIGEYSSYTDCIDDAKAKGIVGNVFSCNRD